MRPVSWIALTMDAQGSARTAVLWVAVGWGGVSMRELYCVSLCGGGAAVAKRAAHGYFRG